MKVGHRVYRRIGLAPALLLSAMQPATGANGHDDATAAHRSTSTPDEPPEGPSCSRYRHDFNRQPVLVD